MSQATTRKHWTWDEYLGWEQSQDRKHELVDGEVFAMVGGTTRDDAICNNLRAELRSALRGQVCRLQGPDLKVRAGDNARYPDALIDCGQFVPDALIAQKPVAIFEVLSKSTAWIDQTLKLRDYESVASIRNYVLISQDEPRVLVYTRDDAGRLSAQTAHLLEDLSEPLVLLRPALEIPMKLLYEGIEFEP